MAEFPCNMTLNFVFPTVSEYPTVDGHHSMQIYMNAMKQCYITLRKKFEARYGHKDLNINDFSYFAYHTPFSKMVQKAFMALILADIEQNFKDSAGDASKLRYDAELVS